MVFTLLMTTLCYNVLLKAKYFHCYRELMTAVIFKGKRGLKLLIYFQIKQYYFVKFREVACSVNFNVRTESF